MLISLCGAKPRAWSGLFGCQFHLARPAFPVWFVANSNKIEKYLPSTHLGSNIASILRKKKWGKQENKEPENLFPFYAMSSGEKMSSATCQLVEMPPELMGPFSRKRDRDGSGPGAQVEEEAPGQVGGEKLTFHLRETSRASVHLQLARDPALSGPRGPRCQLQDAKPLNNCCSVQLTSSS